MAKVVFGTHDRAKIVVQVEQLLREETNSDAPILFTVEEGNAPTGTGAVLDEIRRATLGGQYAANQLIIIHFQLTQPRQATLDAPINRKGIGSYVGGLLYVTTLSKQVLTSIFFEQEKVPHFSGDAASTPRLNADNELVQRTDSFLRKSMAVSGGGVSITPFMRLIPQAGGVLLLGHTLPKSIKFGFAGSLDAKAFFEIASSIERLL